MSIKFKPSLPSLLISTLPLLAVVGCAGNGQNLAQVDSGPVSLVQPTVVETVALQKQAKEEENVTLALSNMNASVAQADGSWAAESIINTSPPGLPGTEKPAQMSDEALLVAEVLGATVDVITEAYESEAKTVLPPPRQMVFHFASGKNNLESSDHEVIKAHAEYLLQHPGYVLVVSGHADNQGSESFNQRLSELRAQNVASLLLAAGVAESQLRVVGMGDAVPMISPDNWRENRRVEFVYQDSMVATND